MTQLESSDSTTIPEDLKRDKLQMITINMGHGRRRELREIRGGRDLFTMVDRARESDA